MDEAEGVGVGAFSNFAAGSVMCDASAIIPAYNEAGRVGAVLAVLREVDELREIIVVDDG